MMSNALERWRSASLVKAAWGERIARVLDAAIEAVEPGEAVYRFVQREGDTLIVAGRRYSLKDYRKILMVGAGKAGTPMASAVAEILGNSLTDSLVIVKERYGTAEKQAEAFHPTGEMGVLRRVQILEAGHPIPDQRGVDGTRRIMEMLKSTGERDLIFCLISGGGSALMTCPVQGITLDDMQTLTMLLLRSGATIHEINALRKHLDSVKGGKLARLAAPAKIITLILSDVVGDPLDVIASGPTVPDPTRFETALNILAKYHLLEKTPASIRAFLERGIRGLVPENPTQDDPLFQNVLNVVVGNNVLAAKAAMTAAERDGFHTLLLTTYLQGEARQAGQFLAAIARQIDADGHPVPRPACLVCGGETTVTVTGNGLGGRNQEMALGAVGDLAGLPNIALVTLATDGGDGPTDAAGAVATGETLSRALAAGMHPAVYLERNDSYHFFDALGDLIKPGPTCTNVNDLAFLFAF